MLWFPELGLDLGRCYGISPAPILTRPFQTHTLSRGTNLVQKQSLQAIKVESFPRLAMNLPLAIDIAIGLIFIYLTFSLMASEIQELISTLLQWRAVHLKESIEGFLSGNRTKQLPEAHLIANLLYEHPAIQVLNHEAKGILARLPRLLTRFIPTTVFGNRTTGPSYIASETFAQSLIETLGLDDLVQKITAHRLNAQFQQLLNPLEYAQVEGKLKSSLRAYQAGRMTLDAVIQQVGEEFQNRNTELFQTYFADFTQRQYLANQISLFFSDILEASYLYATLSWRAKLCRRTLKLVERSKTPSAETLAQIETWKDIPESLRRTLRVVATAWMQKQQEVNIQAIAQLPPATRSKLGLTERDLETIPQAELFYKSFFVYEQAKNAIEGRKSLAEVEQELQQLRDHHELPGFFDNTLDQTLGILAVILNNPEIKALVDQIPLSTLESLQTPARQLQLKIDNVGEGLHQFQLEVANGFDRSMERAAGVYKRNARGVAFCIGFCIAMVVNADTFYMVNQLSQEEALRASVVGIVERLPSERLFDASGDANPETFSRLSKDIYPTLPIGWGDRNLKQQSRADGSRAPFNAIPSITPLFILRRLAGWLITGLAISMGAAFWYDLLSKFMNIRNIGKKPPEGSSRRV